MPADYSRLHRLLKIITLVQTGDRWNAGRLAKACETTERSIYRDIKCIQAAGVPLAFDEKRKGYSLSGDFFLPPVQLTVEETLALVALSESPGPADQLPHLHGVRTAAQKLRAHLAPEVRRHIERSGHHVSVKLAAAAPADATVSAFETALAAIESRRVLDVAYDSAKGSSEFRLQPYELFFNQRAWYLVGMSTRHNEVRSYKLSRFTRLVTTGATFEVPRGWSLDKHLGNAWRMIRGKLRHHVEVSFDAEFGEGIAETRWHKTQETEELADGRVLFRCTVDGLDEIVWWILGMGPHCKVIGPPELVAKVRELAEQTAGQYAAH
jgi:proteasome accessory factor B